MGQPQATAMMRADNRRLKGDLAKSRKMFGRTFTKIGSGIRSKLGGAFGGLGVLGAGIGVAAIGKDVLDFEKTLTRLGIQAGTSGADLDKFRSATIELSKRTGISRGELIGASEALVNLTGSAGFAQDKLEVLAQANLATGASMEELAGLAFSLDSAFKLRSADELKAGLSAIIQIGKDGAIPLNQMSIVLQGVSASFAELGGTGIQGVADLSAALQVLRSGGFATAAEAGTGLQSVITALTKKSAQLKKKGIDVFDKDGAFRGLRPILDDFREANLTIEELTKTLGRVEASKGIRALIDPEGRANLDALAKAGRTSKAIDEDAIKFRESAAGRLQASMNRLKETFAAVFTPERIEKFVQAMGKLADLAGFLVDHAKEFALVWASIKLAGFATQMAGIAASTKGLSVGLAGAANKAGLLGAALAAGLAAGTALDALFDISEKASDAAIKAFGPTKSFAEARDLRSRAKGIIADRAGTGGGDVGEQLVNALRFLESAKIQGVLSETGETSRQAAKAATFSTGKTGSSILDTLLPGFKREQGARGDAELLIQAIQQTQKFVEEFTIQRAKPIEVTVIIDDRGGIVGAGKARSQGEE